MALTVKTNNVPRKPIYGWDLSEKEAKEFDYLDAEDFPSHSFMRYKGWVYDLNEFMRVDPGTEGDRGLKGWHGYISDSYFSGVVIKYVDEYCETFIAGTYISN